MTLEAFGARFHVNHSTVLKWERAGYKPPALKWPVEKDIRLFILDRLRARSKVFRELYEILREEAAAPSHPWKWTSLRPRSRLFPKLAGRETRGQATGHEEPKLSVFGEEWGMAARMWSSPHNVVMVVTGSASPSGAATSRAEPPPRSSRSGSPSWVALGPSIGSRPVVRPSTRSNMPSSEPDTDPSVSAVIGVRTGWSPRARSVPDRGPWSRPGEGTRRRSFRSEGR